MRLGTKPPPTSIGCDRSAGIDQIVGVEDRIRRREVPIRVWNGVRDTAQPIVGEIDDTLRTHVIGMRQIQIDLGSYDSRVADQLMGCL